MLLNAKKCLNVKPDTLRVTPPRGWGASRHRNSRAMGVMTHRGDGGHPVRVADPLWGGAVCGGHAYLRLPAVPVVAVPPAPGREGRRDRGRFGIRYD